MKGRYVDVTVLTQDEDGQISEQFSSGEDQKQPDLEEGKKKSGKSLYCKIAQSDYEVRNMFLPLVQVIQQYWSASGFIESISNPFFVRSAVVQYCMQFLKKLCCIYRVQ